MLARLQRKTSRGRSRLRMRQHTHVLSMLTPSYYDQHSCACVYVCVYVRMCVCVYVCMCVYVCVPQLFRLMRASRILKILDKIEDVTRPPAALMGLLRLMMVYLNTFNPDPQTSHLLSRTRLPINPSRKTLSAQRIRCSLLLPTPNPNLGPLSRQPPLSHLS